MTDSNPDDTDTEDSISYVNYASNTPSATFVIGEKCLAKWSVDGKLYEAKIKKFNKTSATTFALVSYSGYGSECDEWLDIRRIQKKHCIQDNNSREDDTIVEGAKSDSLPPCLFSPLKGDEEEQRINNKFKYLDEPVYTEKSFSNQKRWPTTSKCIISGRSQEPTILARHKDTAFPSQSEQLNQKLKITNQESEGRTRHFDQERSFSRSSPTSDDDPIHSGFSGKDLEKPFFPKIKAGEKVPLVLSAPGELPEIKVPATINRYLRDYQRDGVRFLYKHYTSGHGALLADDMGLGKTVQVIAFIAALLGKTGTETDILAQKPYFIRKMLNRREVENIQKCEPFLIIGPASVLYNWVDELETWGYFRVSKYHKHHKSQTLLDLEKHKVDVVVTSYETYRDNVDELNCFKWEAVFADEVHKIKGLKTGVTKALRKMSCLRRFGLSGTPLQNNIKELWSLLDWCYPGCLGNLKEFISKYCDVIEAGQSHNATKRQLAEARRAQAKLAVVRDKWMLRRTKSLIQDELPQKSEMVVYCQPTAIQISIYKAILNLEWMDYVLKQREPCPCGSKKTRMFCCYHRLPLPPPENKSVRSLTMSYMHLLLKAANHIALLLPGHTTSENQKNEAENICKKIFSEYQEFIDQTKESTFETLSNPKYSGKMKVLQGLLSVFRKQQSKVLIFSYSTQLLDILEIYVKSRGYEYYRLDGSTNQSTRVRIVKDFNSNPDIFLFLISTKAGGIGLNLTGANVVIIYDPNWNPTHDLQAQDRVYRIGQRRDVHVYRLITAGTIEENIYLRQIHKQQLGDVAMSTKNTKRLFCNDELFGIESTFHLRTGNRCLTEDILKRHSKIEEGLVSDVGKDFEGLRIAKYMPLSEGDNEELGVNAMEEGEYDKHLNKSTDSDDDNFGLSYICTQLLHLGEEDCDGFAETANSCGLSDHQAQKKPKLTDDTDKHDMWQEHKQKTTRNDCEESVDDFLNELLDLRTSPSTSNKSSTVMKDVQQDEKTLFSSGKRKQTKSINFDDDESDDILGDLWQEMESVSHTGGMVKEKYKKAKYESSVPSKHIRNANSRVTNSNFTSVMDCDGNNVTDLHEEISSFSQNQELCLHRKSTLKCLKQKHLQKQPLVERTTSNTRRIHLNHTARKKRAKQSVKFLEDQNDATCKDKRARTLSKPVPNTFESITDVFADCGVIHMHQNQKVTGSSKAEDYMSRCAIKDVFENHCNSQAPAVVCKPGVKSSEKKVGVKSRKGKQLQTSSSSGAAKRGSEKKTAKEKCDAGFFYGPRSVIYGDKRILIGQTPKSIKRQQFLRLAKFIQQKCETEVDVVGFAKHVLCSNRKNHVRWLEMYYRNPEIGLEDVILQHNENI